MCYLENEAGETRLNERAVRCQMRWCSPQTAAYSNKMKTERVLFRGPKHNGYRVIFLVLGILVLSQTVPFRDKAPFSTEISSLGVFYEASAARVCSQCHNHNAAWLFWLGSLCIRTVETAFQGIKSYEKGHFNLIQKEYNYFGNFF